MLSMRLWLVFGVVGAAGCRDTHAAPVASFTGTKEIQVAATAAYGKKYPPRDFSPKLEVSVSAGAGDARAIVVQDKQYAITYQCTLKGQLAKDTITITAGDPCEVPVATSQFCLLAKERCSAQLREVSCASEKPHWGALQGKVITGTLAQRADGSWALDMELSVNGCVLALGYNHNAPIDVQGGQLTVRTK